METFNPEESKEVWSKMTQMARIEAIGCWKQLGLLHPAKHWTYTMICVSDSAVISIVNSLILFVEETNTN